MSRSLALAEEMPRSSALGLRLGAAWRLGPRACGLLAWHRLRAAAGLPRALLAETRLPAGPALPRSVPPGPPAAAPALAAAAEAAIAGGWHGPFAPGVHGLDLDLFAPGDIRPVWERNRLLALPLLALAARAAPAGGHLARAEAVLADWRAANPPFRGPAWACGQEAALRGMHLCLALALLEADRDPPAPMRALLAAHARRIVATRAYAAAQDNNHAVSEPAGAFVIALVLGDAPLARAAARDLARAAARLIAADGAFAQASPGYHRLLLDTLAIAEWFRRRHAAPPFAAPFAERARAATAWLHRVMAPGGALPRCGPCDDSAFADLLLAGPQDARGSVERAARIFCGASAGQARDAGCEALGLPCPATTLPIPAAWRSAGWMGARAGGLAALLRTGAPLRFRPGHADLLHLECWRGDEALLRDGGTGAYNPPPGCAWWTEALAGSAGHNTVEFDGAAQMPRLSRFLFARWPRCRALPDGAALQDARGRVQERRFRLAPGRLEVEDRLAGPFARVRLRWRLAPRDWRLTGQGAVAGDIALTVTADAPARLRLAEGWESPAYGVVRPAPVLELLAEAPVGRLRTVLEAA